MSNGSFGVVRASEALQVDFGDERWAEAARKYYDAYGEYVRYWERACEGESRGGRGGDELGVGLRGVAAPVWVGCSVQYVCGAAECSRFGRGVGAVPVVSYDVCTGAVGSPCAALEGGAQESAAPGGASGVRSGLAELVEDAEDDSGVAPDGGVGAVDPLEGLVGRRRRKKKRALKREGMKSKADCGDAVASEGSSRSREAKSEENVVESLEAGVSSQSGSRLVSGGKASSVDVPEWRRKRPGATVHRGYFSDCSDEVQRQLKESRARMLVAKNNEMAIRAEAAVKTRLVEQAAELKRLQTEAKLKKALESKFGVGMNSGFAETVVSNGLEEVCGTPSLSNGSVSPNSSISVCAVRKMEQTIKDLAEKVRDLQREKDALLGKKEKDNGKEKSDEDYDGPISEAEYRRNCDIMYGMRPGATKPMDAKYDELMVKMCAEGFSALGTEDLNELQAYGEFYG